MKKPLARSREKIYLRCMNETKKTSKELYAAANKLCTWKVCKRCNGSGIWSQFDRGGVCFGCGGVGQVQVWNQKAKDLHKAAHILETEETLVTARAYLVTREEAAKAGRTFGLKDAQAKVARLEALLTELKTGTHWTQK